MSRRFYDTLAALSAFSLIFVVGLQYSYYRVFQMFNILDDEGTTMLQVRAFIADPASYESLSSLFGPFYYLHKYAIFSVLQADVTHDINRLTTVVLWGIVAAAGGFFVLRVSRSIVLAAVVQMQLMLHLMKMAFETGHPQEISLVLIAGALALASFVDLRRIGFISVAALGVATGALLLVKINLGVYLAAPLGLALLLFLSPSKLSRGVGWLASAVALLLPAAIMWRHLDVPWGRNYCALVTLAIASILVASLRRNGGEALRWGHVGGFVGAASITIGLLCAVVIGWGGSLSAILNAVLIRPANHSSSFVIPALVSGTLVKTGVASLLLALCYWLAAPKLRGRGVAVAGLSTLKLGYAGFIFYSLIHEPLLLLNPVAVPFIWLLLIAPDERGEKSIRERFPRIFLCLLTAFQTLQAYPVYGSQGRWAVFLFAPVSAICVADAVRSLWGVARNRFHFGRDWRSPAWLLPTLALLVLIPIGATYYEEAKVSESRAAYMMGIPLEVPGATRIRLSRKHADMIHGLVENLKAHCDGFIGMPGFASLYFWTEIPPPGTINNHWVVDLAEHRQYELIDAMEAYEMPCVLRSPNLLRFWMRNRAVDPKEPLVRYIQRQFVPFEELKLFSLHVKKDRVKDAGARGEGSGR